MITYDRKPFTISKMDGCVMILQKVLTEEIIIREIYIDGKG
jgi:hypothetical protein